MVLKLVGQVLERAKYEVDRARRLMPTILRFGVSQARDRLDELLHQIDHWRGACDHTATCGKAVKKTVKRAPKRPKNRGRKNS